MTMKNFKALTKSGSEYTVRDGEASVSYDGRALIHFEVDALYVLGSEDRHDMGVVYRLALGVSDLRPTAEVPVVGEYMLLRGSGDFRVTTQVVSVDILDDEE